MLSSHDHCEDAEEKERDVTPKKWNYTQMILLRK